MIQPPNQNGIVMKYGLALASAGAAGDARSMGELAYVAEESGWDGIFLEDYIVWQGHTEVPTYDPWITIAVMALRTDHIKLGTNVTPLPRRRPWKLVKELTTLDHLSNGRLILGVGLGDVVSNDLSFSAFGEELNVKRRARMLDEALDVIVGLWRGKPFTYNGEFYKLHDAELMPLPVQRPRIPIWVGGGFPLHGPVNRAAQFDGAVMYKNKTHVMTVHDVHALVEDIRDRRGTVDGFDIVIGGSQRGKDWNAERDHIRAVSEVGVTWWTEYIPPTIGDFDVMKKLVKRGPIRPD